LPDIFSDIFAPINIPITAPEENLIRSAQSIRTESKLFRNPKEELMVMISSAVPIAIFIGTRAKKNNAGNNQETTAYS